jgi:hypothetical protein
LLLRFSKYFLLLRLSISNCGFALNSKCVFLLDSWLRSSLSPFLILTCLMYMHNMFAKNLGSSLPWHVLEILFHSILNKNMLIHIVHFQQSVMKSFTNLTMYQNHPGTFKSCREFVLINFGRAWIWMYFTNFPSESNMY